MHQYLSQDWHQAVSELGALYPPQVGISAKCQYTVSGVPQQENATRKTADISYVQEILDGVLVAQYLGKIAEPDLHVRVGYEDSVALMKGQLDTNVAFMQGRFKVGGNLAMLMKILPLTGSEHYRQAQLSIAAFTAF